MLPFTANEQVLYSAIPEMHSRHQCSTIYAALDCQESRSVIKAIISRSWLETLMITVLVPDKTVLNNNLFFFFFSSSSLGAQGAFYISEHLLLCRLRQHILHKCPWTTALNNYEDYVQCRKFAIQSDSFLRSGNCCRQIRLTLNMYFCTFGDILWGCLYNLVCTCKQ